MCIFDLIVCIIFLVNEKYLKDEDFFEVIMRWFLLMIVIDFGIDRFVVFYFIFFLLFKVIIV